MKQTIFETKQRADELLQKAIEIWHKSDQSDRLDGLENDPVVSLLITALAYQANETENDIDMMKHEVLEDFAQLVTPYEEGHAIPATTVVETALSDTVAEMSLDSHHVFMLNGTEIGFLPLLRTRLLNASIQNITRLDGRRWKVSLAFQAPVSDLSGFCFAIKNKNFRDLSLSIKEQVLPLIKPWDFSDLPLSPCFDIDTVLYNRSQTFMASSLCLDLFACQNVRLFCIKEHKSSRILSGETENIDLIFEFIGIPDDFEFDKNSLSLNAVLLANAQQHTVTLSASNPIARVAGYDPQTADATIYGQQFLHMLRPSDEQLYGDIPIEVRRVAADRYNQGALVKQLNNILSKYYSDYYAFQNIHEVANDRVMHSLLEILTRLQETARQDEARSVPGVYLLLRPTEKSLSQQTSLDVSYVTTIGGDINSLLTPDSSFLPPSGVKIDSAKQIAAPMPGFNEIRGTKGEASLRRYFMATRDRLVTKADIKLFCYHELLTRYGIVHDMVKSITVNHRQQFEKRLSGYEILVEIVLIENSFVKRGFADKIEETEILFKSMMNVRSTNIYPIRVIIRLESENNK